MRCLFWAACCKHSLFRLASWGPLDLKCVLHRSRRGAFLLFVPLWGGLSSTNSTVSRVISNKGLSSQWILALQATSSIPRLRFNPRTSYCSVVYPEWKSGLPCWWHLHFPVFRVLTLECFMRSVPFLCAVPARSLCSCTPSSPCHQGVPCSSQCILAGGTSVLTGSSVLAWSLLARPPCKGMSLPLSLVLGEK